MKNLIIILAVLIGMKVGAQDTLQKRPLQFTFIPPIGTNGVESSKYINNFSFNMLGGYNGAVDGFELGSFINVNKQYIKGLQIGGFANLNGGYVNGFQLAGFTNVAGDSVNGFQLSGFLNISGDKTSGAQIAGFTNVSADSMEGFQLSGFVNTVVGDIKGTQVTGFANVATGAVDGVQVAGFLNVARKVKGTQIAFINIADSVEGASIGFLSLVRNGYHTLELNVTESFFTTAALKIGTERFYNIFTAGIQPATDFRWAVGYGVGTFIPFSNRLSTNFDLTLYHINEKGFWTVSVNEYAKLNANLNIKLAEHLTLTAGPSLNLMFSEYHYPNDAELGSKFPPYHFYDHTNDWGYNIKMWAGANVGIRF